MLSFTKLLKNTRRAVWLGFLPLLACSAVSSAARLTVCRHGCTYQDLQQAIDAAPAHAEIRVAAETSAACAVIDKPIRLIGAASHGRRAHLAGGVCQNKAALVVQAADVLIEGFEISDIHTQHDNGACIRLSRGSRNVTIRKLLCRDSQNGILGGADGRLLIENAQFIANGFDNATLGLAHGLYLSGDEVVIRRSQILSTKKLGHSLKAGPKKLLVEDSIVAALYGNNSRALDAFAGGDITLLRNVLQQGPHSDNSEVIGLALEPARLQSGKHAFFMAENWVVVDKSGPSQLLRGQRHGPIIIRDNTFVGLDSLGMSGLSDDGNRWFAGRQQAGLPAFNGELSCLPALRKQAGLHSPR